MTIERVSGRKSKRVPSLSETLVDDPHVPAHMSRLPSAPKPTFNMNAQVKTERALTSAALCSSTFAFSNVVFEPLGQLLGTKSQRQLLPQRLSIGTVCGPTPPTRFTACDRLQLAVLSIFHDVEIANNLHRVFVAQHYAAVPVLLCGSDLQ